MGPTLIAFIFGGIAAWTFIIGVRFKSTLMDLKGGIKMGTVTPIGACFFFDAATKDLAFPTDKITFLAMN